ncbi:mechanosensitive ion channel family protein [Magnetovibrio sp. PR-2]|uniref:mechanosensitive ion channel family protein n=1 Tax=Magnetovibrio sp. PR-2 TaxID=3120356 RepID=UPI002FCDF243
MDKLKEFWDLFEEVWKTGAFGVDVGGILTAIAIFIVFMLLRGLISRFIIRVLRFKVSKTKNMLDDEILNALEEPIRLLPVIFGLFLAIEFLDLEDHAQDIADRLVRSLITAAIFWAIYRAIKPLSNLLTRLEKIFTAVMMDWMVKASKILIAFVGIAAVLEIWGIQVGPILAGLGLFGVAVALGAQDLFKNLIAGILIIAERRFNKGDWVRVDGVVEGTVEQIGFRSTMVRRFDKAPVYVPNTHLSDSAVTNFSAMTHRRIYWHIGIEYCATIDQLKAIRDGIEDYVLGSDEFAHPPEVSTFVRIDKFSDSSIDIMLYCFTKTTNWGEWLEIKERLAYQIKDVVENAGSGFAFPSQSLYVESLPGEAPDIFVPPSAKTKA